MVFRLFSFLCTVAACGCATLSLAAPLLPTTPGTTWEYEIAGEENSSARTSTWTVQIHGQEKSKGRDLLRFDTLSGDDLVKAELLVVNEHGILCYERTSGTGNTVSFDPPQTIIPAPLKTGTKWEMDDSVNGTEMHQQFSVAGEEEIEVPAGKFHAFRLHCEQPWPMSTAVERWFVPGTGFVKEETTTRGPTGRLLNRVTMVLKKMSVQPLRIFPPAAEISVSPPLPIKIKLELAKEREGEATTEFRSDAPNIFVRWKGENLPVDAEARVAWVAEDVGDVAPPNFLVDETTSTITRPDFAARFTLSRPKDGWAPGKYRLELYLEDELKEKIAVTIRD